MSGRTDPNARPSLARDAGAGPAGQTDPRQGTVRPDAADLPHLTDTGNARLFVECAAGDLRWCPEMPGDGWLTWSGSRWESDRARAVVRVAQRVPDAWRRRAKDIDLLSEFAPTPDKLCKHATASEAAPRIDAMIKLARSDERIGVRREQIDADRFLFNTAGRTFNLETGENYPPRRADLLTKQAGTVAAPRAGCPRWIAFLTKIMGGDTDPVGAAEMVGYLQRVLGYCLSGEQREQCFWILYGESGSNGKTRLMDTVRHVMGDYAQHARSQTFILERHASGIPNDVAALAGLRLVTASEPPAEAPLNEALIKEMTGEGEIRARFMREEFFGFAPTFKLLLACNKLPKITGTDGGIWRRPRLIPFNVEITDAEKDKDLGERLKDEAPGVLRWMLDGWKEYQRIGLADPERVFYALDDYRSGREPMAAFLAECCDIGPDHGPTPVSDLYGAYCRWAGTAARSSTWFGSDLNRKKIPPDPRHDAGRRRLRIALKVRQ